MTRPIENAGDPPLRPADLGATPPGPRSATYDATRAISWSKLKHMAVSPKRFLYRLKNPEPSKPAFVIGNAIHCKLLEPEKFDARFAVYDDTRRGKAWDKWLLEHPGVESLRSEELADIEACVAAIKADREAWRFISRCRVEEVATWTDPETGLACKGRLDSISPTYVLDLKKTRDIRLQKFERQSADYLYHGQLAWYHDGATLAKKIPGDVMPIIVTVEDEPPFDVAVRPLEPETLVAGRTLYRELLRHLVMCIEADYWPGVAPEPVPLGLPPWAAPRDEFATEEGF